VKQLFLIINNTYPNFPIDDVKIAIWYDMLKDFPFEVAQTNLRKHIDTREFVPTIAELKSLHLLNGPYIPDAESTMTQLQNLELLKLEKQARLQLGRGEPNGSQSTTV
jgi:hypothetical protein